LPQAAHLMALLGVVGADETEGFKQWTADLVGGWQLRGGKASYCGIPAANHFTVLDHVADAEGEVLRGIAAMIA